MKDKIMDKLQKLERKEGGSTSPFTAEFYNHVVDLTDLVFELQTRIGYLESQLECSRSFFNKKIK
jgi:hypothetical protein